MEITRVEHHSVEELIDNMRRVAMLTKPDAFPYREAKIELQRLSTDDIAPAQRYVLTQELMKVRNLRWALREHGVDLFELNGYVTIWLPGYDEPIDVLPPVIEQSPEADGSVVKILNDGMHRVYLARMERCPVQVTYAENVPAQFPYYAFPLVNGWNDVEIVSELPDGYIKKWHRIKDYKSLYRNFNSGFTNVGGPRGNFTNAGK
ncbi:MAG: hypothetical protein GX139_08630 [Armatimonadetes bacterium]|jgi:hypothetical protein|nr:hypothetical protein [Armatimonadota bacterium]